MVPVGSPFPHLKLLKELPKPTSKILQDYWSQNGCIVHGPKGKVTHGSMVRSSSGTRASILLEVRVICCPVGTPTWAWNALHPNLHPCSNSSNWKLLGHLALRQALERLPPQFEVWGATGPWPVQSGEGRSLAASACWDEGRDKNQHPLNIGFYDLFQIPTSLFIFSRDDIKIGSSSVVGQLE